MVNVQHISYMRHFNSERDLSKVDLFARMCVRLDMLCGYSEVAY